jgi:hypothetical protein
MKKRVNATKLQVRLLDEYGKPILAEIYDLKYKVSLKDIFQGIFHDTPENVGMHKGEYEQYLNEGGSETIRLDFYHSDTRVYLDEGAFFEATELFTKVGEFFTEQYELLIEKVDVNVKHVIQNLAEVDLNNDAYDAARKIMFTAAFWGTNNLPESLGLLEQLKDDLKEYWKEGWEENENEEKEKPDISCKGGIPGAPEIKDNK